MLIACISSVQLLITACVLESCSKGLLSELLPRSWSVNGRGGGGFLAGLSCV